MATRKFQIVYKNRDGNVIKKSSDYFVNKAEAIKFAQLQFAKDNSIEHWDITEVDLDNDNTPINSTEESARSVDTRRIVESFILGTGVPSTGVPIVYSRLSEEEYPIIDKLSKYLGINKTIVSNHFADNSYSKDVRNMMNDLFKVDDISELSDNDLKILNSNRDELNQFLNALQ